MHSQDSQDRENTVLEVPERGAQNTEEGNEMTEYKIT